MRIGRHLTYGNVVATLALVIAVGGTGAYAANQIGSADIKNNSVRSADLKNRKAVRGKDVKRNALGGGAIKERQLDAAQFAPIAGASGSCDPDDSSYLDCATATVRLRSRGRLLVVATGDYFSEGGPANLTCRIAIDGQNEPGASFPGEVAIDNTDGLGSDGFARTRVTGRLAKGTHEVALRCAQESAADGRLWSASVAALGILG